jgi:hypothetical protein
MTSGRTSRTMKPTPHKLANRPAPAMKRLGSSRPRTVQYLCKLLVLFNRQHSAFSGLSKKQSRGPFFETCDKLFLVMCFFCLLNGGPEGCSVHIQSSTNLLRTSLPSHSDSWQTLFSRYASNVLFSFSHHGKMGRGPSWSKRSTMTRPAEAS